MNEELQTRGGRTAAGRQTRSCGFWLFHFLFLGLFPEMRSLVVFSVTFDPHSEMFTSVCTETDTWTFVSGQMSKWKQVNFEYVFKFDSNILWNVLQCKRMVCVELSEQLAGFQLIRCHSQEARQSCKVVWTRSWYHGVDRVHVHKQTWFHSCASLSHFIKPCDDFRESCDFLWCSSNDFFWIHVHSF